MYNGASGSRTEQETFDLGLENPLFWLVLKHIDFIDHHNYRINQDMQFDVHGGVVTFDTWADTKVWRVTDYIFYTTKDRYFEDS